MKVSIIGLGYIGLPLSIEFSKIYEVIAYDKDSKRVEQLKNFEDKSGEVDKNLFAESKNITFTNESHLLRDSDFFIVCVPTPINQDNQPDLGHIQSASELVGRSLTKHKKSIIIYESTVYPGVTEDFCVPIIEKNSNLKFNKEFFCGYSPERINPGDKTRRLPDIVKVVSASNQETLEKVNDLYSSIIPAGTFKASSIKVAEAAKVIENAQRDLNIAFFNELSQLFKKLNIESNDVIEAASTKWNFINFKPGLVGGHCIGVDPYYLTHIAKENGIEPKVILSGRSTNDSMHEFVAESLFQELLQKNKILSDCEVLILGATFKENCSDLRNSKSIELASFISKSVKKVKIYDPVVELDDLENAISKLNNVSSSDAVKISQSDAIILAVSHDKLADVASSIQKERTQDQIVFDLQNFLPKEISDWRL